MVPHFSRPASVLLFLLFALTIFVPGPFAQPPGGGPSGWIEGMISRLDANGNRMLDPREAEGRAKYFLQRMMPDANFSRPIPLDQVRRAAEKARERFSGGSRPHGGDDRRHDADRPSAPRKDDSAKELIPGFGNEFNLVPVFGFGKDAAASPKPVTVTDEDRRRMQDAMRYLDRNLYGWPSREELTRSRSLRDGFDSDANKDGKLSTDEIAAHYARQRVAQQNGGHDSGGGSDRDRHSPPGDRDHHRGNGSGYGSTDSGADDSNGRKVYRFRTVEERLPSGLPDWFRERDANHDGQIMMYEYASDWTDELVMEFNRLDVNRDGIVTPQECLAPSTDLATDTTATAESESGSESPGQGTAASQPQSTPAAAVEPTEINPSYMRYAEGVIKKYDKDGNGVLKSDEWSAMSKSPAAADTDGNGEITTAEYARWVMTR